MTKKNQTKRALISSVIALMLCFSMLVGTTFAWFTDSVSSARNTIVAGNLDIEVYFAHPDDVVDGKIPEENWTLMTSETPVFDNDARWEPGYTQVVYFKIKNVGSLAAKYQFKVDILSETPGTNVNGEQFMLSDYIQTYVNACTSRNLFESHCIYTERDIALNPPGAPDPFYTSLKEAADGTLANDEGANSLKLNHELTLKPADEHDSELYATMAMWMPANVGNEANFKTDTTPPQIDLGITVVATQYTYEGDSYGTDLDKDATYPIVSYPINRPASGVVGNTTFQGVGENAVAASVPAEVINNLPAEVTGISIAHSEPKYDTASNTVSFDDVALVDQNGKEIDLTNNDEYITVTLPKQTVFAVGETVAIYHDGELIGTGIVNEDTTISYVAKHFCQVTVQEMNKVSAEDLEKISYFVNDASQLKDMIAKVPANSTITLNSGIYAFPASAFTRSDVTVVCADGVVFEGTSSLNINGATIVGATFSNPNGQAVSGTINGTFKDCTFIGAETLRWCYTTAGTTVTFDGCVIKTTLRGFHFDETNGDVYFKDCEINGFNAFSGAGAITFEGCTFGNDNSGYNGLNIYTNTNIINCTFNFNSEKTNFIDMEGTGKTLTITNCVATLDGKEASVTDFVGGSKLSKNTIVIDGFSAVAVSNGDELVAALAEGKNVILLSDVEMESATTAPYGNKYAVKMDGGILDGQGNELYMECYGDDYGIMTSGGTIKNLTVKEGCRAVMIMYPTSDIILDNVNLGGNGVLYPINTGEAGAEGIKLTVTNSTLAGWTSFGDLIESASFTNVEFKQGTYYNNIYGRVFKPYVNTTLTNCTFVEHMNLDLSSLAEGQKVTFTNCTVNGQAITADVFTVPTADADYDTELFTVDLPSWATSVNDCIVFAD